MLANRNDESVVNIESQIGDQFWNNQSWSETSMLSQLEKGKAFRTLHDRNRAFIIPNPWDVGSARLLAHLGFAALATTSAGYAFSVGQRDNKIGRFEMMAHAAAISSATDLPVSVDLGNGFGDSAADVAETIRRVAAAGAVGGSIEDATQQACHPIYEHEHAVERIRAAVEVARSFNFPFVLTARAENYLVGKPDLKDTIKRLQAYQEAGADVLYAPGLTNEADISALVRSVDKPVNVLAGLQGVQLNLADLSALGVKRVSVGSALSRAAIGAFLRAAMEMREKGTFSFVEDAISFGDLSNFFPE
jgi:2-methylisocitrate lyase-like PEP mutase family enzyme